MVCGIARSAGLGQAGPRLVLGIALRSLGVVARKSHFFDRRPGAKAMDSVGGFAAN